jgi:hypothetical protein
LSLEEEVLDAAALVDSLSSVMTGVSDIDVET